MANVILRQEAINDLNSIWAYTLEEWSEKQADNYYASLELACVQIGKNPEIGKRYEEVNSNLLGLRIGKHIIFYQIITENEIEIVRILHEHMDLKGRLNV
jgi:toxin ParE1/3/4